MKIYIVYSYDNMPYSDITDYPQKGFLRKDKADALCKILNKLERKGLGLNCEPSTCYEVREMEVEE